MCNLDSNNPLFLADPYLLYDKNSNKYYIYGTNSNENCKYAFPIYESSNLKDFKFVGYALNTKDKDIGEKWFWAPEVFYSKYNGYYFMFYSCLVKDEYKEKYFKDKNYVEATKICVAYSKTPYGPFKDFKNPVLNYYPYDDSYDNVDELIVDMDKKVENKADLHKGAYIPMIDADILFDDGKIYLYGSRNCYKNTRFDTDFNKYVASSEVIGVELNTDWYYKKTLIKPSIKREYKNYYSNNKDKYFDVVSYRNDKQDWENYNIDDFKKYNKTRENRRWCEGSSIYINNLDGGEKEYYLFYSSNFYMEENYNIGLAISSSPLKGYIKYNKNPLIDFKKEGIISSGHGSILKNNGEIMYCFHGRTSISNDRQVFIGKFDINTKTLKEIYAVNYIN